MNYLPQDLSTRVTRPAYPITRPTRVNELESPRQGAVVQTAEEDDAHEHGLQDAQQAGHQTQENVVEKHEVGEVEVQTPALEHDMTRELEEK